MLSPWDTPWYTHLAARALFLDPGRGKREKRLDFAPIFGPRNELKGFLFSLRFRFPSGGKDRQASLEKTGPRHHAQNVPGTPSGTPN